MKRRTKLVTSNPDSSNVHQQLGEPLDFDTVVQLFITEQKIHNRTKRTLQWYSGNLHPGFRRFGD